MDTIYAIGGALIGSYVGVRVAVAEIKTDVAWLKKSVDLIWQELRATGSR